MNRIQTAASQLPLVLLAVLVGCSPYHGDVASQERRQLARAAAAKASGDVSGACSILARSELDVHPALLIQHARCLLDPKSGGQDPVAARAVLERVYAMRSRYRGQAALLLGTLEQQVGGTPQAQLAWLDRARDLGEPGTDRPRLVAWKQAPDVYRAELIAALEQRTPSDAYSALELARLTAGDPTADPATRQARIDAALRGLTLGAKAGSAGHARTLAWLYDTGELVPADPERASGWLAEAARAGGAKALTKLADRAQATGDLRGAQRLLDDAVAAGGHQAAINLSRDYLAGRFEPADEAAAAELITRTAESDAPPALRIAYGQALLTGRIVARDPVRGEALLAELAAVGNGQAQTELGRRLLRGLDLPADAEHGRALLEAAAASGDAGAMFHLARAYLYGHGVAADPPLGLDWLRRAAESGSSGAQLELGRRHLRGLDLPVDVAQGCALLEALAEAGHDGAMLQLGLAYAEGAGLRRNPARARHWLGQAAAAGNEAASKALGMDGDPQANARSA